MTFPTPPSTWRLVGYAPFSSYLTARLWNVAAGAAVPDSERRVIQAIGDADDNQASAHGTAPTSIRLQMRLDNATGSATTAQLRSNNEGYTSLRYHWIHF
ncbi:hypothetical protein [Streptomyces sp. WAC 06725]|uniref:hypothetical protein n=1 Tax=Streptomyces sp. WAC 06725 TaxID=2203209 RepID=UPI001C8B79BB|nr:hypothetical protein [Streptomyces sp. WAC 06725]